VVAIWEDGLAALSAPAAGHGHLSSSWRPGIGRIPIVVTGSSGAGKTEAWRQLTGRDAPDQMSRGLDQGYVFRSPAPVRKKSRIAITTIPGQTSRERFEDLDFYFAPTSYLVGVIFVATFGFDHVWPHDADLVASGLSPFTVASLRDRNIARELSSFAETCARLRARNAADRNLPTPWLLVLVNKVDLYATSIAPAEEYYRPTCGSLFDAEAQRLSTDLGAAAGFRYEALPVAMRAKDYNFSSNLGDLSVATQLAPGVVNGSIDTLLRVVEELSYG
jgi:hypothetical protein